MEVGLAVAGFICLAMAVGHETVGSKWVLPGLDSEQLPKTPFGPPSMSLAMIRVTWRVVTIFVAVIGAILVTIAMEGDPRISLLRWLTVGWLTATVLAVWMAGRSMRSLRGMLRLPVPFLWVIVAALCWWAST